jgi:hypothetical protein
MDHGDQLAKDSFKKNPAKMIHPHQRLLQRGHHRHCH